MGTDNGQPVAVSHQHDTSRIRITRSAGSKAPPGRWVWRLPRGPHHLFPRIEGIAMSTIEKLLVQKQQLMEQLASDHGPNEREEIQRLLAKIETALTLLEPNDPISRGG
jgi:hypothetical protein